jgi:hypothetical protein
MRGLPRYSPLTLLLRPGCGLLPWLLLPGGGLRSGLLLKLLRLALNPLPAAGVECAYQEAAPDVALMESLHGRRSDGLAIRTSGSRSRLSAGGWLLRSCSRLLFGTSGHLTLGTVRTLGSGSRTRSITRSVTRHGLGHLEDEGAPDAITVDMTDVEFTTDGGVAAAVFGDLGTNIWSAIGARTDGLVPLL